MTQYVTHSAIVEEIKRNPNLAQAKINQYRRYCDCPIDPSEELLSELYVGTGVNRQRRYPDWLIATAAKHPEARNLDKFMSILVDFHNDLAVACFNDKQTTKEQPMSNTSNPQPVKMESVFAIVNRETGEIMSNYTFRGTYTSLAGARSAFGSVRSDERESHGIFEYIPGKEPVEHPIYKPQPLSATARIVKDEVDKIFAVAATPADVPHLTKRAVSYKTPGLARKILTEVINRLAK